MSVKIRLTRRGNKNNPFYRIVVANAANPNNGKAIEQLGTYDPKGGGRAVLKKDRYAYWLGVGAIPSDTVRSLIDRAEEYTTAHKTTQTSEGSTEKEDAPAEEASAEETPAEEKAETASAE